ncbi:MAG: hypothetical protein NUV75_11730 [Gallionella sp.]|nr:hypothetical protein [Gallionella sp.]
MKIAKTILELTTGICLIFFVSVAHAEKWVEVFANKSGEFGEVDIDSIRKGDDGLIYFAEATEMGGADKAVDCQKRISYMLSMSSRKNPDWRSSGIRTVPGTYGAKIVDFVCSRTP